MRLMPPPLIVQDGGEGIFGASGETPEDSRLEVYYATNRLPIGPRDNRIYTIAPDRALHFGTAGLRVGNEGTTWAQLYEWSTGGPTSDRPFINLERMREEASQEPDAPLDPETADWLGRIDGTLARRPGSDVIVYVHGANTTVERAAGQAAQLWHFTGQNAVVVLFAWPTAENFLRYPSDIETAFGGAPHLADLIGLLATHTRARKVDVFTYSAGGTVGSAALGELGRERPGIAARLGNVYHAAPDADFRDFVDDLAAYAPRAGSVTAAINLNDSALRLAQVMNRASRAGRPDLRELSETQTRTLLGAVSRGELDVVQVSPETIPTLSRTSHTFWYDDPWVSGDVLVTLLFGLPPGARMLDAREAPGGAAYFTFAPDFADRIPTLRRHLLAEFAPRPAAEAP
ncbi:alpha/beta hydrolase [Amaricoccus solimangrovi]|uniref:Alpha/beta hydrolase n=2 Tax=Amaricoccus solimangrovi TaxID=2589815 RepID=A0A501WFK5_9RHOB|nr:alpha/beta hydrolase [Amaricoccus solimangrovi]